ncbi:hypothetical protein A5699_26965 [Mycobacterium sp. E802]|uniref:sulfotransferase family protein n=1 Tax=Mycobacterium sp. E802 TaxID=1834152 RepID=UPI000801E6D4|nr:hypothetical protein [Mycobacterium sp. E802]OBG84438.1 hypothetical protein A5699_26965 [Mycobacterium sp. E802]
MTPADGHAMRSARPVVVFVLGVNRSGTSALTRVLSLCGGGLPPKLVGSDSNNPRGYWEPFDSHRINFGLLRRHRSAWFDPTLRLQEHGTIGVDEKNACVDEITAFLGPLTGAPFLVLKDLNITSLTDLWFEGAQLAGFDVAAVIAVRHPEEVVASLAALNRSSPELAGALWLKGSLLAEAGTRNVPRVFVEYANFLADWQRETKRISTALEIDLGCRDDAAIEEFLSTDLHRQRQCGPVAEPFGTDWIATVYDALSAASRDEQWDPSALDRVFEAYRGTERGFRMAFENFQRFEKVNRFFRPSVAKAVYEIRALSHRRRGTWA